MTEEKKLILKMLKEGKISEDEALKLLDALGSNEDIKIDGDSKSKSVIENTQHLADKLAQSVDKILKKTGEKLNKFEFDYDYDFNFDFGKNKSYSFSKFRKELVKNLDININSGTLKSLTLSNFAGNFIFESWEEDYIKIKAVINYNDRYLDENYNFFTVEEDESSINIKTNYSKFKKQPFEVDFYVNTPYKNIASLEAKSVNGDISAINISPESIKFSTVNGTVNISDIDVKNLQIKSTNGSSSAKNITGESAKFSGINGNISLHDINFENTSLKLVNGDISIEYLGESSNGIESETINGKIYINIDEIDKPITINAKKSNKYTGEINISPEFNIIKDDNVSVKASNRLFDENVENPLVIDLSTINGKIRVE